MKKILAIILMLTLCFMMGACGATSDLSEGAQEQEAAGGYTNVGDGTITPDLEEIFKSANVDWKGMPMKPIQLLQTQVVAGTNYKFLVEIEATEEEKANIPEEPLVVTIYQDLEGNCSAMEITNFKAEDYPDITIIQKDEEVTNETDEVDEAEVSEDELTEDAEN